MDMPINVFPAHAGMSPLLTSKNVSVDCFPRSRGDEPAYWLIGRSSDGFSPLTRG